MSRPGTSRSAGVHARIHALARRIPFGKVATYGQLAEIAGECTPRMAGYAMAHVRPGDDVPWHRVVNSHGRISERPGAEEQQAMLKAEGVVFGVGGTIDLNRFGWNGPGSELGAERA